MYGDIEKHTMSGIWNMYIAQYVICDAIRLEQFLPLISSWIALRWKPEMTLWKKNMF